jgi:hypothetical protein
MGMNGAALASLLAMGIYDSIKLYYVWRKFGIQPFSNDTLKVTALLLVLGTLFYFIRIPLTPFFSILAKSLAVLLIYFLVLYRYRISEDVFVVMTSLLQKTRGGKDNHS